MTVKELITALSKHPENMDVFVYSDNPDHEYAYELVNEVEVRKIKFGGNGDPIAKDAVVVLELL